MANRREERERLRQAREERESSQAKSNKTRLIVVYAVVSTIALAVVAGIVIVASSGGGGGGGEAHVEQASGSTNGIALDERKGTPPPAAKVQNLRQAAKLAGCDLRLHLKDEGHTHISPTSPTPDYKTNPPTTGAHVEPPYQQADGAYSEMPGEIFFVHSLEHGRLEIQYSPKLSEADQLELKGLYDTMYGGTLLFPNDNMPYAVAATTWTNLLGCPQFRGARTLDAIRAFGKATWNRYGGEEGVFPFTGPTPANPSA
ncbi:MAG TPA: DUF3105 domain-containing protein [Solirubrobacterales bacterium]|nr:DUF3105 domain-containing protein [Solirubrobacterales bacterium]